MFIPTDTMYDVAAAIRQARMEEATAERVARGARFTGRSRFAAISLVRRHAGAALVRWGNNLLGGCDIEITTSPADAAGR